MHVLYVPNWYPNRQQPALGRFFQDQIALLAKFGVQVGVVISEDLSLRHLNLSNLVRQRFQTGVYSENDVVTYRQHSWHLIPSDNSFAAGIWIRQMLRLIDRYIAERGRPDILHGLVAFPAGRAVQRASERYHIPYVITEHSSMYSRDIVQPWKLSSVESAFRGATAVAAVSHALAGMIAPYARHAVTVIPNFIDTDFFTLPPVSRTAEPFVFLAAGNLVPVKGYDLLIQAFAQQFGDNPRVQLRIAGSGALRATLEALAVKLDVSDRVTFTGRLSQEGIRQEMWNANALVVSSYHETFSVVLIEALATGLPVVSTLAGGPQDIVTEQVGVLVPTGDLASLGEGMQQVFAKTYDSTLLRDYAVENFSPSAVVNRVKQFYTDALNNP